MNIEKENNIVVADYNDSKFDGDKNKIEKLIRDNEKLKKIADKYSGKEYSFSPEHVLVEINAQIKIDSILKEHPELEETVKTHSSGVYSNPPSIIWSVLAEKLGIQLYGNYKNKI